MKHPIPSKLEQSSALEKVGLSYLSETMPNLTVDEIKILLMLDDDNKLVQIAPEIGVTPRRIGQIRDKLARKIERAKCSRLSA